MFNNQKTNKNAVQLLSEVNKDGVVDNPQQYYEIALEAVKQNPMALDHVNTCKNNGDYYRIALEAVKQNGYVLHYVNKDWALKNSEPYYVIALAAVSNNGLVLEYVNEEWVLENSRWYYDIVLVAVNNNGLALGDINEEWVFENSEKYYEIALEAVNENGSALGDINEEWVVENSEQYYNIALEAVNQNGLALGDVNEEWAVENSEQYYNIALVAVKKDGLSLIHVNSMILSITKYEKIALEAVKQNGLVLASVNEDWALKNFQQYYNIALAAVKKDGLSLYHVNHMILSITKYEKIALEAVNQNGNALEDINKDWTLENPQLYEKIALAALSQNGLAFRYAGEVFRNNIKIAISSLMDFDRKRLEYNSILSISYKIDEMLRIPCLPRKDILLYVYMLNNKNVSNNFKNALFNFFINEFKHTVSDKFTLYKNILECYLTLSKGYTDAFPKYKLLDNLKEDDSTQLHMFLSVADPSALKNSQLPKLLNRNNHHNDIIKDYLTQKDTYNLKCIKNFNIYSSLLPKNLFVVNYDKIIKKINENNINIMKNDILMRLVLYYLPIEDLLALCSDKPKDKLEVKYLNIDLEFHGPEGYISTGIQALVDAIKLNNGSLSNRGKYKYDTFSTTYNLVDIELSLCKKLIEVIE